LLIARQALRRPIGTNHFRASLPQARTHDSFDYTVAGTRVLCNPRGYAKNGVNENAAFEAGLVVNA
jgi:hypothetical protein